MSKAADLLEQAHWSRDRATTARRLAQQLSMDEDRARLISHAEELEDQARQLEKQAAAMAPVSSELNIGLDAGAKSGETVPPQLPVEADKTHKK
jgi:hypothetical protein